MTLSRDKSILGIISITSAISLIYLLQLLSFKAEASSPFHLNLIATITFGFNISILFSWLAFGTVVGSAISIFLVLLVIWLDFKMGLSGYSIFTLPFFLTAFLGYAYAKAENRLEQTYRLRSEKLEEESNVFSNNIKEKKMNISSLEEKMKRYSALEEVVESLSTVLLLDNITQLIIEKASKTLGREGRLLLFLVNEERQELMLSASKDALKVKEKKGDIFDHWVLRHRKSLMIEDVVSDFRFPTDDVENSKTIFKSLIAAPLVSENKVIGILRMDSLNEFMYTQDDLRLLDIISDLGAVAVQNAMLYSKTQELAIKDSLTGLFVRRYFLERFKEEIRRAARNKGAVSFLILDIDHFKDYNDRYGHMAGDLVLKHLAKTIASIVSEGDIVVRYGGEEIGVLLCGRAKAEAVKEAEEIRKRIKDKPLILRRNETRLSVSIGVSAYPEDATLEEEMIRIADERLYKAKAGGRDRVCSA